MSKKIQQEQYRIRQLSYPIQRPVDPYLYLDEYDEAYARRFDELIDWKGREMGEGSFFLDRLHNHGAIRVLDLATGTGFHSIKLLKHGFDVISVDGSAAMLEIAQKNAYKMGVNIKPVCCDWRELSKLSHNRFDAVICLGNSVRFLQSEIERVNLFGEVHDLLCPNGLFIVDNRNDMLLTNGSHPNSGKYYYCSKSVSVETDQIDESRVRFAYQFPNGETFYATMFPFANNNLVDLLGKNGFGKTKTYGNFQLDSWDVEKVEFFQNIAVKKT